METEESGTEREKEGKEGKGATLRTPFMFMHLTLVLHLIFTTISHANNTAEPKNIAPFPACLTKSDLVAAFAVLPPSNA